MPNPKAPLSATDPSVASADSREARAITRPQASKGVGRVSDRLSRRSSPSLLSDDVGLECRVVAQALVAPGVVVDTGRWPQLGRAEQVVEAPAAAMSRDALPRPARLARCVAVEGAIGVPVAEVPQPRNDAELGLVPHGSALGPQAPA